MTILVGILGPMGSGKSTVAQYLVERYGARRYSLATPIKEFAQRAFEFTDAQLYGSQAEKEAPDPRYGGKSARWFMQRLGTEGGRMTFGEDFWTRMLLERIERDAPDFAVVDDVRYPNEAALIRGADFTDGESYVWRLETPWGSTGTHSSESTWLDAPYDFAITPKAKDLGALHAHVDDLCRRLLIPTRKATP